MDYFDRQNGVLCADGVPLPKLAEIYGTPLYVYSCATLQRHVRVLQESLAPLKYRICYAVKACGTLEILRLLGRAGCSFDGVSLGELMRVHRAGLPLHQTIFSGVGKTDNEIDLAIKNDVLYLSVESQAELAAIGRIAKEQGRTARISIRVNPDVDAKTHPYISTGMAENKFGVPTSDLAALVQLAKSHPGLKLVGLTCHIGSQLTQLSPFEDAARRLFALTQDLQQQGFALSHVGLGGGLGIRYTDETPPDPGSYGNAIKNILGPLGLEVVLEPGRVIVGNACVLLTRVLRQKRHGHKTFVIVDAGMNDLMRPALYGAKHNIEAVAAADGEPMAVDVVGPVCESADTFGKNVSLPPLQDGSLLVVRGAGAYGSVMGNQYNGRPRPAEVLCDNQISTLIRHRETFEDLWRHEI